MFGEFGLRFLLFSLITSRGHCNLLDLSPVSGLLCGLLPCPPPFPPDEPPYCSVSESQTRSLATCSSPTLDDLKNARSIPANEDRSNGLTPSWINLNLARRGQKFAQEHLFSVLVSHAFGLTTSPHPDLVSLLIFSGRSFTLDFTTKRYLATVTQVIVWYTDVLWGPPNASTSDILISLAKVRSLHIAVMNAAVAQLASNGTFLYDPATYDGHMDVADWTSFLQDMSASNIPASQRVVPPSFWTNMSAIPMNQQGQALTQFAFVGYPVLMPDALGIVADDEDIWAYNHLWAVLGYALGIDDKYNIALQPDLASARALYQQIFDTYTVPAAFHWYKDAKGLGDMTYQAFNQLTPIATPNFVLYRTLKDIFNVPGTNMYDSLSPADILSDILLDVTYIPLLKTNPVFRASLNTAVWNVLYANGLELFGTDYSTRYLRARNVFYATYT